jgi:hypothetical protein
MSDTQSLSVPAVLRSFADPSGLLPGEDQRDFEAIRQMIIDDILPETNLKWLWIFDLVELSWEILRYRRLKQKILRASRVNAIQAILQRPDSVGIPEHALPTMRLQTLRNAADWSDEPNAAREIEARLERHGFDVVAINAEVFIQARDAFAMFDNLMHAAQSRRIILLREINARRDLAEPARKVSDHMIEATFARGSLRRNTR